MKQEAEGKDRHKRRRGRVRTGTVRSQEVVKGEHVLAPGTVRSQEVVKGNTCS